MMPYRASYLSVLMLFMASTGACIHPKPTPPTTHGETNTIQAQDGSRIVGAQITLEVANYTTDKLGRVVIDVRSQPVPRDQIVQVSADGYQTLRVTQPVCTQAQLAASVNPSICEQPAITLLPSFPSPPTRDYVISQQACFNTLQVQTEQFGPLPWYETAWVSMNPADRTSIMQQKMAAGCKASIVSLIWDYGEAGTDYGTGQLVPPADFTNNPAQFRALAKEAIADGSTPLYYLGCDGGYDDCLQRIVIGVQALLPQPGDPIDLTQYGVLFPCLDSCVPGYQPPSQVDDVILKLRTLAPNAYVGMELSTGYSFWWMGQDDYARPAGQALDVVYLEMDNWPSRMSSWQILARLVRPYNWPSDEPQNWDSHNPPFYPLPVTPRGAVMIHCFEYGTYVITHHIAPPSAMLSAIPYYQQAGCTTVDQ